MDLTRISFLFLHLLMIMQVAQHCAAREMDGSKKIFDYDDQLIIQQIQTDDESDVGSNYSNVLRLHSMDHHHHHAQGAGRNSSSTMDPSVQVFFHLEDLKIGKTMVVHFPDRHLSSSNFLPKEEADKIPFSSKQLPYLLHFFSFPKGSPQATAMEDTLRECDKNPIKGETKLCATSIASMLDFAKDIFTSTVDNYNNNNKNKIQLLSTIYLTKLTAELQNFTITELPKEISASKMISCHTMPYPYGILYCHYQESESKVFRVELVSENDDKIEAIAVCHMDTSEWSRNHISFRALGIEPGNQPVCHFFPADHFVLLPPN